MCVFTGELEQLPAYQEVVPEGFLEEVSCAPR